MSRPLWVSEFGTHVSIQPDAWLKTQQAIVDVWPVVRQRDRRAGPSCSALLYGLVQRTIVDEFFGL